MLNNIFVKEQKAINNFWLFSLIIYLELQILPQIIVSFEPIKYIIRDGFIIVAFSISLFGLLFTNEENIRIRKKNNYNFLAAHIILLALAGIFLNYLIGIDYQKTQISKDSLLYKFATIFRSNIQHFTVIYRIEYLCIIALCHLSLLATFFHIRLMYLWYPLAFIIGIAVNELIGAIICPLLFYVIWTSNNLYLRRLMSLAFGLALSTVFNEKLWLLLSQSVAKINLILLGFFFNTVENFKIIENPTIGTDIFNVAIAPKCSGMEGLTTFFIVFLVIFIPRWRELATVNFLFWGTLGIILMYFVNVLRIFILIVLGHFTTKMGYDPNFIVDLWHSYGSIVLYALFIYGYMGLIYKSCFLPEEELAKLRERMESARAPETMKDQIESIFNKIGQNIPTILRFPVDLLLLFFHTVAINFSKTKLHRKLLKRNCQCYLGYYQEDQVAYCRFSTWYGTPEVMSAVCPLIDMKKRGHKGYVGCKAQPGQLPIYWFRSLIVFITFLAMLSVSGYFVWRYVEYHADQIENQEVIINESLRKLIDEGKELFAQKKFIEAEQKFLQSIQLQFRAGEAYSWLARTYEQMGEKDKEKIFTTYVYAVNLAPAETYAQIRVAYYSAWNKDTVVKAEQHIRIAQENEGDEGEIAAILALCEWTKEDKEKSKKYLEKAQELVPDHSIVIYLNALLALEDTKYPEAKEYLQKLAKNSDMTERAQLLLAETFARNNEPKEAENILLTMIEEHSSLDAETSLIKLYFIFRMEEKAMTQCQNFIEKISENLVYLEKVAQILTDYQQVDLALNIAMRNLEKYPSSIPLRLVAAKIFYRYQLFLEMEKHCRFVLVNTDKTEYTKVAYSLLGDMYLLRKIKGKAIQEYQNLLKIIPDSIDAHCLLAQALEQEESFKQAMEIYDKASKIDSTNALPYFGRARLYGKDKKWDKAIQELNTVLKNDANSVNAKSMLATVLEQKGEVEKAKAMYRELVEKHPKNSGVAANNLANLLLKEGKDLEEAARLAYIASKLTQNHPKTLDTLGFAFYKLEKYAEAYNIQQRLVQLSPEDPEFLYHLGLTLVAMKEEVKAIPVLEKALQFGRRETYALDIRNILRQIKK